MRAMGDSPTWLSPEERVAWLSFDLGSRLIDEALDQQMQRDSAMPHTYYAILVMLASSEDRSLRMSQLAQLLRFSPSRLTHAVASLERSGWVRRESCAEDRRGQTAVLTAAGSTALVGAAPGHVAEVRRVLFDALSDEQVRQLGSIFTSVLEHLGVSIDEIS